MKKIGINVEMLNGETHFLPLDDIIFIKVEGKFSSFYLKDSTPEAKKSLTELWKMIEEAGKGYDHNLVRVGRKYIINLSYYDGEDTSRNMVILKRGPYTKINTEIAKKSKGKKDLPDHVKKYQERLAAQKIQKELDEKQDSKVEEIQYYKEEIGEAALNKLRKILKERDMFEVLENCDTKKSLKVSIQELNDTHLMDAGHEYVDLGLPSGTLWSACNLGEYDKDLHSYYAWGALYESDSYDLKHYTAYAKTDIPHKIDIENDVANKAWGGNWRIPTYHEFRELAEECVLTWCAEPKGCLVKGKNGKKIFLPANGYKKDFERNELQGLQGSYWTSMRMNLGCGTAFQFMEDDLRKDGIGLHATSKIPVCYGLSIRPVMSKSESHFPAKEKKNVLIINSFRFNMNSPFTSESWNPEGWNVIKKSIIGSPDKVVDYFKNLCKEIKPDVIVSVGSASFFCKQLKGYPRICLNPNYLPSDDLAERRELIKNEETPQKLIDEYRKVEKSNLTARGDEKCCVVYGQPDDDEVYPTWDDPALESWERIDVDPWASPRNWMNTFLYPLMDKMI
jgi:hypothetical protein